MAEVRSPSESTRPPRAPFYTDERFEESTDRLQLERKGRLDAIKTKEWLGTDPKGELTEAGINKVFLDFLSELQGHMERKCDAAAAHVRERNARHEATHDAAVESVQKQRRDLEREYAEGDLDSAALQQWLATYTEETELLKRESARVEQTMTSYGGWLEEARWRTDKMYAEMQGMAEDLDRAVQEEPQSMVSGKARAMAMATLDYFQHLVILFDLWMADQIDGPLAS